MNPSGWDEFIIPKNYMQVLVNITMVSNTKILFSNLPKKHLVCPDDSTPSEKIDISTFCNEDISCTMFENINMPFKFRAEQCAEMLYILMIYPEQNEDETKQMEISAQYIDETPCYTVSGGVHEIINSETKWGARTENLWESTVRWALITCKYEAEEEILEKICIPRTFDLIQREEYWAHSGLVLKDYGELPLETIGTLTIILIVVVVFLITCFWAGWYYNLRIYQNKKPPFSVPRFWPQWCFPQPRDNYNYSFEEEDESQNSFDVLDNQARGSSKRGTTKYRAPNFYFEDE